MKILVLGSGAGAGERTHSSIAVSGDGVSWVLLNAPPDIGEQLRRHPRLQPRPGRRDAPIKAVILMDAQIDHVTGLLGLREGPCIDLYATPCVFDDLTTGLPLLNVLQHYCGTRWHMVPVDGDRLQAEFEIPAVPTLRFTALAIPGQAPPYSPHRREQMTGDHVALRIEDLSDGRTLFYSPGLVDLDDHPPGWLAGADCVLVDGMEISL